jgi:hypothetical protein
MVMRAELATAPDSAAAAVAPDPFAHGRNENGRRNRGLNENSRISPYDPVAKSSVAKSSVAKSSVAKSSVAKSSVAKSSVAKS